MTLPLPMAPGPVGEQEAEKKKDSLGRLSLGGGFLKESSPGNLDKIWPLNFLDQHRLQLQREAGKVCVTNKLVSQAPA